MSVKTYRVAQHLFQMKIEGDSFLWPLMEEPYGPFETEYAPFKTEGIPFETPESGPLFCLQVLDGVVRDASMTKVYSSKGSAEPGMIVLEVWRDGAGHYFEFTQPGSDTVNGRLHVDNELKEATVSLEGTRSQQWLTFNTAVNFCYLLATAPLRTVLTHASCVRYKGKAYLFLGRSGTGKSTHSRMWLSALEGVELMNDDHPVVRVHEDGTPVVYGSPWSGKTRCYKNVEAPAGGIVRISRAPYNKARRLSMIESYASLMTSCSGMTWEKELADGRHSTIEKIISRVPCWVMECLPDEDAARVCQTAVTNVE